MRQRRKSLSPLAAGMLGAALAAGALGWQAADRTAPPAAVLRLSPPAPACTGTVPLSSPWLFLSPAPIAAPAGGGYPAALSLDGPSLEGAAPRDPLDLTGLLLDELPATDRPDCHEPWPLCSGGDPNAAALAAIRAAAAGSLSLDDAGTAADPTPPPGDPAAPPPAAGEDEEHAPPRGTSVSGGRAAGGRSERRFTRCRRWGILRQGSSVFALSRETSEHSMPLYYRGAWNRRREMKHGPTTWLLAAGLALPAAAAAAAPSTPAPSAAAPSTAAEGASRRPVPAFSDVPPDHWAAAAVNELAALGILVGYPAPPAPPPRAKPAPQRTRKRVPGPAAGSAPV